MADSKTDLSAGLPWKQSQPITGKGRRSSFRVDRCRKSEVLIEVRSLGLDRRRLLCLQLERKKPKPYRPELVLRHMCSIQAIRRKTHRL